MQLQRYSILITVLSALCYVGAFILPVGSILFIPISFALLWRLATHAHMRFFLGLIWGLLVYGILTYPVMQLVYSIGSVSAPSSQAALIALAAWAIIVCYTAWYAGLWFALTNWLGSWRWASWLSASMLFFWLIDAVFLWPFNYIEGYGAVHPLVPLMRYMPTAMLFLGKPLLTLAVLILSSAAAQLLRARLSAIQIIITLSLTGFLLFTAFTHRGGAVRHVEPPEWLARTGYISPPWVFETKAGAWDCAHIIFSLLERAYTKNNAIELILLPESSFPYRLNKYPEIVTYWFTAFPPERRASITIIIGAHRQADAKPQHAIETDLINREKNISCSSPQTRSGIAHVYNSCYQLCDNKIVNYYDKQHGLLMIERVPSWCCNTRLENLFVSRDKLFVQGRETKRTKFNWQNIYFEPCICSDNFFNRAFANIFGPTRPLRQAQCERDVSDFVKTAHTELVECMKRFSNKSSTSQTTQFPTHNHVQLCLVNDAWCADSFLPHILYFTVYMRACLERKEIIYISHTRAVYISRDGGEFYL